MEYLLLSAVVLFFGAFEIFFILRRKRKFSERDRTRILLHWEKAYEKLAREPAQTVIEADALLDFVLKKKGFRGPLGEKLRKAEKIFSRIDDIWAAHKLRNKLVHEVGFHISANEARLALSSFKKALIDIGIKL